MNDKECLMFYSNCGAKNDYRKCLTPGIVIKSTCYTTTNPTWEGKDVLYIKGKTSKDLEIHVNNSLKSCSKLF